MKPRSDSNRDVDRAYGQLTRQFSIADSKFAGYTKTDAAGNEAYDTAAISQRVGEINALINAREQMLQLVDEERAKLAQAVAALKRAIDDLVAAIKAEQEAAQADARQVAQLERDLTASNRAETLERRKKKPSKATLNRFADQQTRLRAQIKAAGRSKDAHTNRAGSLSGELGSLRSDRDDAQKTLLHDVLFRHRDVELDISELRAEGKSILSTTIGSAGGTIAGADTGSGSEGGDTSAGVLTGTDSGGLAAALQAQVEELLRQLGQANLALGIEAAQLPVIASFQKGTLHVPQTGLYALHAGEQVTPAGRAQAAGSSQPVNVHISLSGPLEPLANFIDARIEGATDQTLVTIGREADRRRRGGRF